MEEELGVRLFERHLRGATLTPEGRNLLDRAQYLLRGFDQLKSEVRETQGPPSGPLIIGMTPNFATVVGGQLAYEIKQLFPDAQLRIVEAYSPALRQMLRDRVVDVAVLSGNAPTSFPTIAGEPLFEDRLCLIGRSGDPVLERSEISARQLRDLPLILTGISSAGIRNEIESFASRRRIPLTVSAEVDSFALAASMIRLNLGYTVYIAEGVANMPDLHAVPITGLWLQRSLAWPADRPLSRLAGEVLPLIRHKLLALVETGQWKGARLLGRSKKK